MIKEGAIINDDGSILFRRGTGGNVEITYFRTNRPRKGHGKKLLIEMLKDLRPSPPYHTIYGFTRTGNVDAHAAYRALGFTLSPVSGVYKDGDAVVFSAPYADLCARHLKD